jgi:hypothetical protein
MAGLEALRIFLICNSDDIAVALLFVSAGIQRFKEKMIQVLWALLSFIIPFPPFQKKLGF